MSKHHLPLSCYDLIRTLIKPLSLLVLGLMLTLGSSRAEAREVCRPVRVVLPGEITSDLEVCAPREVWEREGIDVGSDDNQGSTREDNQGDRDSDHSSDEKPSVRSGDKQ